MEQSLYLINMQCSYENCLESPCFLCDCTLELIFLCANHVSDHILLNQTGAKHNTQPIKYNINSETKIALIEILGSKIQELSTVKSVIIEGANKKVKEIFCELENSLSNIRKQLKVYESYIKEIFSTGEKQLSGMSKFQQLLTCSKDEAVRALTDNFLIRSQSTLHSNLLETRNSIRSSQEISPVPKKMSQEPDYSRIAEIRSPINGHTEAVRCVIYSSRWGVIISASLDKTIQIWDGHLGLSLKTLIGHTKHVNRIAISNSGHYIASAGGDAIIII